MPISQKYNLLFIHVPRTGGTSILEAIDIQSHDHKGWAQYTEEIKRLRSFSVVRNPYDRLVSIYEYIRMEKSHWHSSDQTTPMGIHPLHQFCKNHTFAEFCWLVSKQPFVCEHTPPQHLYICSADNTIMVSRVLRFENLAQDFTQFMDGKVRLRTLNASTRAKAWQNYYTPELSSLVYEIYKKDFLIFDYPLEPLE